MTHEKQVNFKPPHTVFTTLTHTHTHTHTAYTQKEPSWCKKSKKRNFKVDCLDPLFAAIQHLIKGPIARPVRWQWNAIIFVNRLPWVAYLFPMVTSVMPSICRAMSFQLLELMIKQTKTLELVCLQSDPSTYAEAENIHENSTMGGTWWNNNMSSGVLWLCCCHITLCACR